MRTNVRAILRMGNKNVQMSNPPDWGRDKKLQTGKVVADVAECGVEHTIRYVPLTRNLHPRDMDFY